MIAEKIAMADNVAQAVEKFAQVLPLDIAEIFTWYFEQKGVENPERFLNQEKLDKQTKTEQVQEVIQDINIQKQLTQVLGGVYEGAGVNNVPVAEMPVQQNVSENISEPMNRLLSKIRHNRRNNKKGGN